MPEECESGSTDIECPCVELNPALCCGCADEELSPIINTNIHRPPSALCVPSVVREHQTLSDGGQTPLHHHGSDNRFLRRRASEGWWGVERERRGARVRETAEGRRGGGRGRRTCDRAGLPVSSSATVPCACASFKVYVSDDRSRCLSTNSGCPGGRVGI